MSLQVDSESTIYEDSFITSEYVHKYCEIEEYHTGKIRAKSLSRIYQFRTERRIGKVGLMMIGFGGNNGTTILGGLIANKNQITWRTKKGQQKANMLGSLTQSSTMKVGQTLDRQIYMKFNEVIPMVDPTKLIVTGWDINSIDMGQAMRRAQVFDYDLQNKLYPYMKEYKPLPSIYYPDFIASNQKQRADNIIAGQNKIDHLLTIRKNIRDFKKQNDLQRVVILWTANTQRFANLIEGIHDSYEGLMNAIKANHQQISPSMIFALAAMQENCIFINGSPQNTIVKGLQQVPKSTGILIGNDFKTGQTKFKTSFIDFLIGAGIKPKSLVSYNHLGNNDGKNLSSEKQFKSKEISKSSCINDMLENSQLYDRSEQPDHTVVIKYVPNAGDSKKAIDEYVSEIFMGGEHTFVSYNVCEDSLLAAGIIIDLIVLSQLMDRIEIKKCGVNQNYEKLKGVVSFLGYLMKAPESKGPTINSLNRQRSCIENLIRVLTGLPLEDNLLLNFRL